MPIPNSVLILPTIVVTSPDGITDHSSTMTFPNTLRTDSLGTLTTSTQVVDDRSFDTETITPSSWPTLAGVPAGAMCAQPYNGPSGEFGSKLSST
ncbi:hypothetical protein LTS14_001811 [Recurvomyces mirabilis]|uniref:uncharacterized protein n=1 Tax=Recurvomyces mirabilis TaxID=574656 RepID=UPI002DDF8BFA|nr:hypothetical protein LTS14_001811 [Recurvomyces mirabilis]